MDDLEPLLRGVGVAALIRYDDNRTDHWEEGSYWPSTNVLVFKHAGKIFSLVVASMQWQYEWEDEWD